MIPCEQMNKVIIRSQSFSLIQVANFLSGEPHTVQYLTNLTRLLFFSRPKLTDTLKYSDVLKKVVIYRKIPLLVLTPLG